MLFDAVKYVLVSMETQKHAAQKSQNISVFAVHQVICCLCRAAHAGLWDFCAALTKAS